MSLQCLTKNAKSCNSNLDKSPVSGLNVKLRQFDSLKDLDDQHQATKHRFEQGGAPLLVSMWNWWIGLCTAKPSRKSTIHVCLAKRQRVPAHLWQLRFMWTFKQNTQRCISLTNQYDHHFSSPSFSPSLLLLLASFSSASVWENWSAWMEWYQPADRVIRPAPSFLRSSHRTFDT